MSKNKKTKKKIPIKKIIIISIALLVFGYIFYQFFMRYFDQQRFRKTEENTYQLAEKLRTEKPDSEWKTDSRCGPTRGGGWFESGHYCRATIRASIRISDANDARKSVDEINQIIISSDFLTPLSQLTYPDLSKGLTTSTELLDGYKFGGGDLRDTKVDMRCRLSYAIRVYQNKDLSSTLEVYFECGNEALDDWFTRDREPIQPQEPLR